MNMPAFPCSGVRRMSSALVSASSKTPFAGVLIHKNSSGKVLGRKRIYADHEITIGRDKVRCQYAVDDPYISKRQIRIYTVVYENDESNEVDTLVYAEDLSHHGTYWNDGYMGKGNGGSLLSDGDVLRLSRHTLFVFSSLSESTAPDNFDYVQEKEMATFRKDYVVTDRLLGAGAFGKVFMAIQQDTRTQVACKMVDLRRLKPKLQNQFGRPEQPAPAEDVDSRVQIRKVKAWGDQQKRERGLEGKLKIYFREIDILSSISHPNIVGLEKVYVTDNTMYMMQDLVTAGDLFSYLESKNGHILEVEAAVIVRQILLAVRFLHKNNIVHRDIKPDNILMTSLSTGCRLVLTDFGAARRIRAPFQRMASVVGTHEYAAPEILRRSRPKFKPERERPGYTRSVDMWAVGCVCVVLLTGGWAFVDAATHTYSESLARNCSLESLHRSKEWQNIRQRPRDFVNGLLILDEDVRMTASEALQHSWFSNKLHKNDFEDLYRRTIEHWKPRILKKPLVDFNDGESIKQFPCSQPFQTPSRSSRHGMRRHHNDPVEPPYKPFPRSMHITLWPQRSGKSRLTEEVRSAIKKWEPSSAKTLAVGGKCVSSAEDRVKISPQAQKRADKDGVEICHRAEVTSGHPNKSVNASNEAKRVTRPAALTALQTKHYPGWSPGKVHGPSERSVTARLERAVNRGRSTRLTDNGSNSASTMKPPPLPSMRHDRGHEEISQFVTINESINQNLSNTHNPNDMDFRETYADVSFSESRIKTPVREHKLKRRTTISQRSPRPPKRRGSIFDLAEDGDEQETQSRKTPYAGPPRSPKASAAPPPLKLFLPR